MGLPEGEKENISFEDYCKVPVNLSSSEKPFEVKALKFCPGIFQSVKDKKKTDEKELEAIEKAYCKNRKDPLLIGSVKTNTGHSEASAVMFQVAKVLVALESGIIPANIQYEKPNPNIKGLVDGKMKVLIENRKWNPTYAAINAIGLDSYYGHLLLKANPKKISSSSTVDQFPRLLVASTRTEEGIKDILDKVRSKLK